MIGKSWCNNAAGNGNCVCRQGSRDGRLRRIERQSRWHGKYMAGHNCLSGSLEGVISEFRIASKWLSNLSAGLIFGATGTERRAPSF